MKLTGLQTKKAFDTMDFWETMILMWWIFFNKRKLKIWERRVNDGMSGCSAFYEAYESSNL